MPTYDISNEISLGWSHYSSVDTYGKSQITLSDAQVENLKRILETAYSEGKDLHKLDLRNTDLEHEDPELYKIFYDAYYDCAYQAEYEYWVVDGYQRSEVLDGIDWEHARYICKERYGYNPQDIDNDDYDEDEDKDTKYEEEEAEYDFKFQNWFRENIISSTDMDIVEFERKEDLIGLDLDFEFDSPLYLPLSLIKEFLATR